jgi:hypothetical protein
LTLAAVDIISKMWTGVSRVDGCAPAAATGVLIVLHPVTPSDFETAIFYARALAAIANAESSFAGAVGDTDASAAPGGPSISPWQIERTNAVKYGWYSTPAGIEAGSQADRDAYAALPTTGIHLWTWARHAAQFFNTDVAPYASSDLTTALRVWNGGPSGASNDATATYAQRSAALISDWATS